MKNMTNLPMDILPENKAILLEALGTDEEVNRFATWLLSKNMFFESYAPDAKRELLARYMKESFGEKPFRVGRDG